VLFVFADPAGQDLAAVRAIRDDTDARVQVFLAELLADEG
jgi:hypothetical protein